MLALSYFKMTRCNEFFNKLMGLHPESLGEF